MDDLLRLLRLLLHAFLKIIIPHLKAIVGGAIIVILIVLAVKGMDIIDAIIDEVEQAWAEFNEFLKGQQHGEGREPESSGGGGAQGPGGSKDLCDESESDFVSPEKLRQAYSDHARDFGATSEADYAEMAKEFFRLQDLYEVKVDYNEGKIRIYNETDNTFGSYTLCGDPISFFKPTDKKGYWDRQPGELING
jgi:hypothetical protein